MITAVRYSLISFALGYTAVCGAEYSKVSNAGEPLPASAAFGSKPDDWACTYDSTTGLMWENKTTDGGLRDVKWNYSWYSSDPLQNGGFPGFLNGGNCLNKQQCDTEGYVRQVNAQGLCGAKDWRFPSGIPENLFESTFFINTQNEDPTKGFWLANTSIVNPEMASVRVNNALGGGDAPKNHQHGALLVRTAQVFKPINFKESQYQTETWSYIRLGNLTLSPDETLFAGDTDKQTVVNLRQDGTVIRSFGQFNFGKDSHARPSPVFMRFAPDGTLYVDDYGNKRIQHLKVDGTLLSTLPKSIDSFLVDMAFTSKGDVLVLYSGEVQQLKPDGSVAWKYQFDKPFTLPPSPYYSYDTLERVMVAADGTIYALGVHTNIGTMVTWTFSVVHLKADGSLIGITEACCANKYAGNIQFPSRDVVTKAGVKFVLAEDHINVQKLIPNTPEYTYTSKTGTVVLENITVGSEHYWVQLQDQGSNQFKVLKAYLIKPEILNTNSAYDAATGLVTLPKLMADGLSYRVVLQRLDNGWFGVKSADRL